MSVTVWLSANTLHYPQGGGHMWVFLNWALGLRELGCEVVWLEGIVKGGWTPGSGEISQRFDELKVRLAPYGFDDHIAVWTSDNGMLPSNVTEYCIDLEAARDADLLVNVNYQTPADVIKRFRRSALLDIDPGLLQTWLSDPSYKFAIPSHDMLFTIGETVGQPGSKIPDVGLEWHYTPPCVSLSWWRPVQTTEAAPLTTVSHWVSDNWLRDEKGELWSNEKRTAFMPYLDLPRHTSQPLELALQLRPEDEADRTLLRENLKLTPAQRLDKLQAASMAGKYGTPGPLRGLRGGTKNTYSSRSVSLAASSRRACDCRTHGSAIGRSATWRAASPPSLSTPAPAGSCQMMLDCFALRVLMRRYNASRLYRPIMRNIANSVARWLRSISTREVLSSDCWSRHSLE